LEAGYDVISIDDCWMSMERDGQGRLQPDPERFPMGIDTLFKIFHQMGFKAGIYEDYGSKTCGGYPGTQGHEWTDVQTFVEWGTDYLKLDGCNSDPSAQPAAYQKVSEFLDLSGRDVEFSCSMPAYIAVNNKYGYDWEFDKQICHTWRFYDDVQPTYSSLMDIINYATAPVIAGANKKIAGPGSWFDMDMLLVGVPSITLGQQRMQMGVWAVLASPMIMGNDARHINKQSREILLNREVIEVSQDPLGSPGYPSVIDRPSKTVIYTRQLSKQAKGVAIANWGHEEAEVRFSAHDVDANNAKRYLVRDLFRKQNIGTMSPNGVFCRRVKGEDILLVKLIPISFEEQADLAIDDQSTWCSSAV